MNKHTVTLETANKLKELGWDKETLFWWTNFNDNPKLVSSPEAPRFWLEDSTEITWREDKLSRSVPAPIVSELLEELKTKKDEYELHLFYRNKTSYQKASWVCSIVWEMDIQTFDADTPASALALMWIYLKENKLL